MYYRDDFSWSLSGNVFRLHFDKGLMITQQEQSYNFLYNRIPERTSEIDASPEGLKLKEELVILHLGQMRRVEPDQVSNFLARYAIEP